MPVKASDGDHTVYHWPNSGSLVNVLSYVSLLNAAHLRVNIGD